MDTSEGWLYRSPYRCFLWDRSKVSTLDKQGEKVMAWDGKEDRRVNPHTCNSDTCQYHYLTERLISDLRDAIVEIKDGQETMNRTVIELTQSIKGIDRVERRIDKLEEEQKQKDKEQDERIRSNESYAIKIATVAGALVMIVSTLGPVLLTKLLQ